MKKSFIISIVLILTNTTLAGQVYNCVGKDESNQEVEMMLDFDANMKEVIVNYDNNYTLTFESETAKAKKFGDYDYDGYGGFIEVSVPKNLEVSGDEAAEEFKVKFKRERYSELGHVGTEKFSGNCQLSDN